MALALLLLGDGDEELEEALLELDMDESALREALPLALALRLLLAKLRPQQAWLGVASTAADGTAQRLAPAACASAKRGRLERRSMAAAGAAARGEGYAGARECAVAIVEEVKRRVTGMWWRR